MPRLLSEQDWPIADEEVNRATLAKLLPNATELETIEGNKLYREGTAYDGCLFLQQEGFISYYMEYLVHSAHFNEVHSVTQTSVWRSLSPANPENIASYVMFKYLVPKYPAVMSDKIQTERGRDFWVSIMSKALKKNLVVELVALHKNLVIPITSDAELRQFTRGDLNAWGKGLQYEQLRFLIRK
jgi:hypothetical protein